MVSRSSSRSFFACVLSMILAAQISGCGERDELQQIRDLQDEGKVAESIERLEKMIDAGDRRPEVLYRYGRGLSAMGEIGRAVWALDAVIGDPEYTVPAAKELAHNLIVGGNFDFALATLDKLREKRTDGEGDEDLRAMLIEARAHLESRRSYSAALEALEKVLELDPENEEALRYKVVALLGDSRNEEAYETIRKIGVEGREDELAEDSKEGEAFWCSVGASFQREAGDLAAAEEVVETCLERFPTHQGTLNEAVTIYTMQGKRDEALAILERASEEDPENRALRMPFVLQLRAMGRYDEAESVLRTALENEKKKEFPDDLALANLWNDVGRFLIDRGKVAEGLEAYDVVVSLMGEKVTAEFLIARAEALLRVGRYDEALEIAEKTKVGVHRPMIRGRVAFERGEFDKALVELGEAARVWPDNAPIRYYLAQTAEVLGDFDRAIEEYRQAIRSDRSLDAARVRLGRLHLAENRVMQAAGIMMFDSPIDNALASVDSKEVMIEIQARAGMPIDLRNFPQDPALSTEDVYATVVSALARGLRAGLGAKAAVEKLAELHEDAPQSLAPFLLIERIGNLVAAGEIDEAVKQGRSAVARHPDDSRARMALGRALGAQDSTLEEAYDLLTAVVAERPRDAQVLVWLGEIESRRGEAARAAAHFESALEISPVQSDAVLGLARALVTLGRRPEAVARLEVYLNRQDPYDGNVALEFARLLAEGESNDARRIEFAVRALRFGAGQPAAEYLEKLDPLRFGRTAQAS